MTETQPLLERLEAVDAELEKGEARKALMLLVDIREAGFVNRELDKQIDVLRDDQPDLDACKSWVSESIERVKQFGGNVFRDVEDLGEVSMGFDKQSWVEVDSNDEQSDLFGMDLDDLLDMDLDAPPASIDQNSEPTKSVSALDSAGDSKSQKLTAKVKPAEVESEKVSNRETVQSDAANPPTRDFDIDPGDDDFENPFADIAEDDNVRELTPLRGVKALDENGEEQAPENPFADLMEFDDSNDPEQSDSPAIRRPGFESGRSVARYAGGVAPPPPTHRLKGARDVEDTPSLSFDFEEPDPEPEQEGSDGDDFDFDLGLDNPNASPPSRPFGNVDVSADEVGGDESDDFDFDLGLNNPNEPKPPAQKTKPGDASSTKPGDAKSTKPKGDASQTKPGDKRVASREEHKTPMAVSALSEKSDPIDEDEFFALADSFASESSAADWKPKPDNPFEDNKPTGVRHGPVEESSFVLEEASAGSSVPVGQNTATNLSAILMEARRMYENGEFEAAMNVCEKVLSRGENQEAAELKNTIEGELERVYLDRIGSLSNVPELAISLNDLASQNLDHRAGFLISQIDGMMPFEDLLELSSMSRAETLQVMSSLLKEGIIRVS